MPKNIPFKIMPYEDEEVQPAIKRLLKTREFNLTMRYLFPDKDKKDINHELKSIDSTNSFQKEITSKAAEFIINRSTDGFSVSGMENIEANQKCLFISNHRDIVLDSGLLNYALFKEGIETTQMAIGDNLVQNQMLGDLFSLNKSFSVKRNVPISQLLDYTLELSSYIRQTITSGKSSIWLAQRQGRAQDGNDLTQGGIIKMLSISDDDLDFMSNFCALNIVPVSISYEYDPTDSMKIPKLLADSKGIPYVKKKKEDVKAMIAGISGFKGHVHIAVGKKITADKLKPISNIKKKNERLKELANLIDQQIIFNYKLWVTNFIAYDLLNKTNQFSDRYSKYEADTFKRLIRAKISHHIGKTNVLRDMLLIQYANPIKNKLNLGYKV
jgi:hypothetical protein